jgi:hypothetical protein
MRLELSKEGSLHSCDYFELLNSIDMKSNISGTGNKNIAKSRDGIIINPDFISEDFEKVQREDIYIKCCSIRFLYKDSVVIFNGITHTDSLNNATQLLGATVEVFERGFTLSNDTFISCEEAPSFIKNYKLYDSKLALKLEKYIFVKCGDLVTIEKADKIILKGIIVKQKTKKKIDIFLLDVSYYCYKNISKALICSIHHDRGVMYLYELNKFFTFSKRKKATFNIL